MRGKINVGYMHLALFSRYFTAVFMSDSAAQRCGARADAMHGACTWQVQQSWCMYMAGTAIMEHVHGRYSNHGACTWQVQRCCTRVEGDHCCCCLVVCSLDSLTTEISWCCTYTKLLNCLTVNFRAGGSVLKRLQMYSIDIFINKYIYLTRHCYMFSIFLLSWHWNCIIDY